MADIEISLRNKGKKGCFCTPFLYIYVMMNHRISSFANLATIAGKRELSAALRNLRHH